MKKPSKLSGMKMPMKGKFDIMGLDSEDSADSKSELAGEGESEMGHEGMESAEKEMQEENPALASASDDELMAELRKRGLDSKAQAASEPSQDEEYA